MQFNAGLVRAAELAKENYVVLVRDHRIKKKHTRDERYGRCSLPMLIVIISFPQLFFPLPSSFFLLARNSRHPSFSPSSPSSVSFSLSSSSSSSSSPAHWYSQVYPPPDTMISATMNPYRPSALPNDRMVTPATYSFPASPSSSPPPPPRRCLAMLPAARVPTARMETWK